MSEPIEKLHASQQQRDAFLVMDVVQLVGLKNKKFIGKIGQVAGKISKDKLNQRYPILLSNGQIVGIKKINLSKKRVCHVFFFFFFDTS